MTDAEILEQIVRQITIGKQVRDLRLEQNLTQWELGQKLGVSNSMVCLIEAGRASMTGAVASNIKRVLGFQIDGFEECDVCTKSKKPNRNGYHVSCNACEKRGSFLSGSSAPFSLRSQRYHKVLIEAMKIYEERRREND